MNRVAMFLAIAMVATMIQVNLLFKTVLSAIDKMSRFDAPEWLPPLTIHDDDERSRNSDDNAIPANSLVSSLFGGGTNNKRQLHGEEEKVDEVTKLQRYLQRSSSSSLTSRRRVLIAVSVDDDRTPEEQERLIQAIEQTWAAVARVYGMDVVYFVKQQQQEEGKKAVISPSIVSPDRLRRVILPTTTASKNTAADDQQQQQYDAQVLKWLAREEQEQAADLASSTAQQHDWIFLVTDRTYVHVTELRQLVHAHNPLQYHVIGKKTYGSSAVRQHLTQYYNSSFTNKGYCDKDPGVLLSRPALLRLVEPSAQVELDVRTGKRRRRPCIQKMLIQEEGQRRMLYGKLRRTGLLRFPEILGYCLYNLTGAICSSGDAAHHHRANNNRNASLFLHYPKGELPAVLYPENQQLLDDDHDQNIAAELQAMRIQHHAAVSISPLNSWSDIMTLHHDMLLYDEDEQTTKPVVVAEPHEEAPPPPPAQPPTATAAAATAAAAVSSMPKQEAATTTSFTTPPLLMPPWRQLKPGIDKPRQYILDDLDAQAKSHGIKNANVTALSLILRKGLCQPPPNQQPSQKNETQENNERRRHHHCTRNVHLRKCTSYTTSTGDAWYSAQSPAGAYFALVHEQPNQTVVIGQQLWLGRRKKNKSRFAEIVSPVSPFVQFDFAVPVKNESEKLIRLAKFISTAARHVKDTIYGQDMNFRMLISVHSSDDDDDLYQQVQLSNAAKGVEIVWVPCESSEFHRALASNCVLRQACTTPDCIVSLMDVDMNVRNSFVLNSMTLVNPATTAYFPIVFSEFNPETVQLVDTLKRNDETMLMLIRHHREEHRGLWREYGFGMWSMAGSDAMKFRFLPFKGWGGEDVAFYNQVASNLNIVRMRENGLVHIWHAKDCGRDGFVSNELRLPCINSGIRSEGLTLGVLLKQQAEQAEFEQKNAVIITTTSNDGTKEEEETQAQKKEEETDQPETAFTTKSDDSVSETTLVVASTKDTPPPPPPLPKPPAEGGGGDEDDEILDDDVDDEQQQEAEQQQQRGRGMPQQVEPRGMQIRGKQQQQQSGLEHQKNDETTGMFQRRPPPQQQMQQDVIPPPSPSPPIMQQRRRRRRGSRKAQ